MSTTPPQAPGCPEPGANPYEALDAPALRALLAQRDAQLAAQAAGMEEWMHAISHDLRAPLRHITSYGPLVRELLQESGLPAEAQQEALAFLDTMDQSARRMGRMLEGLLVLSRIARVPLRREAVDLAALVEQVRAAQAEAVPERGMEWHIAPDLPTV
jgi:light-regulated signal transduction histidine kinase (bacteriophytochrome)